MRGKRSKQYRKLMQQYGMLFGFREPYQIILDAEILQEAARCKMDFVGGLERTLHGEVKPMITQCCIRHLYASEPKDSTLLEHVKAFERRRCGHHTLDQPLSTLECMSSVVDPKGSQINKHRLVVASQEKDVRAYMRRIPGVPLIYLKRSVMIMEPMAGATEDVKEKEDRQKFRAGLRGARNPDAKKRGRENMEEDEVEPDADGGDGPSTSQVPGTDEHPKKKRKRGPSGPNPLSVKRTKKDDLPTKSILKPSSAETQQSRVGINPISAVSPSQTPLDELAKRKRKRRHKSGKENDPSADTTMPGPSTP